ncbi:MAG: Flp pilus assembly protein CpaB [Desulfobacterales bacterium]|nr:MAG: Flp pilus assembly protein CpaB [Desulfobacterales bacterium]
MNRKAVIGILVGLLTGVCAVLLTQQYLKREKASIYKGMEMVDVVIFSGDLEAGTTLEKKHFYQRKMPKKYKHGNAVKLEDISVVIGQSLIHAVKESDPLLWTDLGDDVEEFVAGGFSKVITAGERALAIPVDRVSGVGGVLIAGDHVDVLTTVTNPVTGETATITLLQNLTVLAAGGKSSTGKKINYQTVLLQVTLAEAELLVFATEKGKITLALRNGEDIQTDSDLPKVDFSNILHEEYLKKVQVKRNNIEVIKQGKMSK